jgi:signal transduction histidine kinase
MRRKFMRRVAGFVGCGLLLLVVVVVLLGWLLGALLNQHPFAAIFPAVAILVVALVVARLLRGVGRTAGPLGDLIEASARVEAGELGVTVPERGPGEVRALGRAFNAMSSRLAEDVAQRRQLLADVSHELRTPLTVIQGSIEGMLDGLYPTDREQLERLLAETRQLERLIEDLRTLSLADAGALPLRREPTDLGALAAEVVAGFEPAAAAESVRLDVSVDEGPPVALDPLRMRQVISNLVSNALRHTPSGGSVGIRVSHAADAVSLEVTDTGTGMDAEAAARAFDRFWRSGDTAGAGLGLAIVRDLVRAHGGEVSLTSAPGQGTTVSCRFPTG